MKISFLAGKKTYIVMLGMLIMAFASALSPEGTVNVQSFAAGVDWQMVLNALGIGAIRAAIAKAGG